MMRGMPAAPARSARALAGTVAVVMAATLSACGGGSSSGIGAAANDRGYIAGNKQIEKVATDKRSGAVTLAGTTLDGTSWSVADAAGKVVVVNLWGSWCPPCEAEMPHLQSVWTQAQKAKRPVVFMGVDLESRENGLAAVKRFGLTFPSLSDPSGTLRLGLQGKAEATPTTLILDRQGRIAARISGEIPSETTLRQVLDEVVGESA
jgi:thiol-disulfide isomerase/thioredoxin